ncbi:Spermidine/putrescine-binding periplasmic protein precursor [Mycolicibacterium aurum]|uniref:Spermidine/putrescine-binding periplasmic protein n=1 Tax=Mycolicibacterium aurum TaxID=1791 RepID=A0A448IH45_MYCAU|nr:PotD/PotF family extracellular solute-binding protein [Mycolicibacterium aurum]VEG51760.1 Spermidine/putrescine-binding periplasmic protein precursor [Mycolicibacterium aurum]
MRIRSVIAVAAVSLVAMTGFTACSSSEDTTASETTGSTAEPATKPDRLVIRIWSGDQEKVYADTAAAKFTEATGIPIVWDTTDEAVSYTKLNQEISANQRPSADASFNAQQRAYTNAARGWTIPLNPELVPNLEKVTAETAAPPDHTDGPWNYVNPYTLTVPFIVRTDLVDPATLKTWDDLFKPELRESLAVDTIYSSTAFGFAQSMGVDPAENPPAGMDPVWAKISELRPNLAQLGSNADVVTALTNGSVKVAISNTGSGIQAQNAGAPVALVAPAEGIYVVGDAYYIHKGIPDENAYYAQVFANYLLDPDVQSTVAEKLGLIPVNPDATVPAYMSDNKAVFPRTAEDLEAVKAIVAPVPLMAKNDEAWQKAFDAAIGR